MTSQKSSSFQELQACTLRFSARLLLDSCDADVGFALTAGIVSTGALSAAASCYIDIAAVVGFPLEPSGRLAVSVLSVGWGARGIGLKVK